ncbi:ATP synthase subunit I [Methylophaga muralis]|jgi:ATP synthase protein I|uniref:ATP synthase I chain n=1 Tax=Methylophaga muralis TaxID=291169 RepID=A0A1E3GW22_9GAMM|nr:ATP synthase subunit I [Methylophaga muralis]ODN68247.1 ATP synthase I chain [Methylophaga muralis]
MEQLTRVEPINRLLKTQFIALIIMVACVSWLQGKDVAIALSFGGMISLANTLLLRWHLLKTVKKAGANPELNLGGAFRCIAERWFLTIAMFAVGFAVLELSPLPLLLGFAAMQIILFIGHMRQA